MPGNIYLCLLIFCGIWSQEINATLADEEIEESSNFLIRQKRVISQGQDEARIVGIRERPYIVHIKRFGRIHCMGTILSHRVVITTAECALFQAREYAVVSRTSSTQNIGTHHNVTNIKVRNGNIHGRVSDGIALFTIDPAIIYGTFVKKIELHVGLLLPGMLGSVSGWGYNFRNRISGPGTNYPQNLRSIEVPILAHQNCVNIYRDYYPITDKDICTFHPLRHCGHTDGGAPLVIDDLLVGIFLRSGPLGSRYNFNYPDVFAFLQHTDYSGWIRANI